MAEALTLIGAMYRHEKQIRDDTLTGAAKREYRTVHIRPVVEAFWKWCRTSCERTDLLPKNPLAKALNYALQRRLGWRSSSTTPRWLSPPIIWNERYVRFPWANETGCSPPPRSAPDGWAPSPHLRHTPCRRGRRLPRRLARRSAQRIYARAARRRRLRLWPPEQPRGAAPPLRPRANGPTQVPDDGHPTRFQAHEQRHHRRADPRSQGRAPPGRRVATALTPSPGNPGEAREGNAGTDMVDHGPARPGHRPTNPSRSHAPPARLEFAPTRETRMPIIVGIIVIS